MKARLHRGREVEIDAEMRERERERERERDLDLCQREVNQNEVLQEAMKISLGLCNLKLIDSIITHTRSPSHWV